MNEVTVHDLLAEIHAKLSSIADAAEKILTVEEVSVALRLTVEQVKRRMKDGRLPKGKVWFEQPGIGPYFSWQALCGFIKSTEVTEEDIEEPAHHWRRRK